jgi:hypothetical protein
MRVLALLTLKTIKIKDIRAASLGTLPPPKDRNYSWFFEIVTEERTFQLLAPSEKEMWRWIDGIRTLMVRAIEPKESSVEVPKLEAKVRELRKRSKQQEKTIRLLERKLSLSESTAPPSLTSSAPNIASSIPDFEPVLDDESEARREFPLYIAQASANVQLVRGTHAALRDHAERQLRAFGEEFRQVSQQCSAMLLSASSVQRDSIALWQPEELAQRCHECESVFGVFNWKHVSTRTCAHAYA